MDDVVRCAVVGCGVIAPTHLSCLAGVPEARTTWVCDLDESRARAMAERFGVPRFTTRFEDVLAAGDVDAVHVCTDHASHAPLSVAALAAGKHVLCEKPLASDRDGVRAMLDAHAARPALVFAAVFQHRYEPMMRALRELVRSGRLGRLATAAGQLRCHRSRQYYRDAPWRGAWATEGGSVLINQAVHFFDMLLFIGGAANAAQALFANLAHGGPRADGGIETEDTLTAALRLDNGALATFEATSASHLDWEPTLAFHGTEGSVEWRGGQITKAEFRDPTARTWAENLFETAAEDVRRATAGGAGKGYYGPGHPAQIADFIGAVREKRAPYVTVRDAAATMAALFAVYDSAKTERRVAIP